MRLLAGRKLAWSLGAVGIVAVAAAVAIGVPAYGDWQRRNQLTEAFRNLSDIHTWMVAYYAHHRSYARNGACGAAIVPDDRAKYFTYTCAPDTVAGAQPGQTFKAFATGKSRYTAGFTFTIDEKNLRATTSVPADWGHLPPAAAGKWLDRPK